MATAAANNFCKLVQDGTLKLPRQAGLDPIYNGIVVSEDMLLVSDRDACNVTLHRRHDGKLLATSDKLEQWACGICIINDMEICVTLWNSTIEIMSIQCKGDTGIITKVRILHAKTTFDECHGVSKFMDKKVVVCGRKQATICWCIVSLNDGHVDTIHQICKGDYWSHLTTKNNMLYISCWVNSDETGVYAYDIRNPSKRKFKYKHDELTYPTGITVDTKGFIFVCNNRPPCIHHLTDRYELVTIYREGMPWDPYGSYLRDIFWDQKHGLLYLTCWRSNGIIVLRPEYSNQEVEMDSEDSETEVEDELFLNDQRIASILHKYTISHNNQDIKDTVPVNGISPTKKQRLSQDDGPAVPAVENIPNNDTVNQISEKASDNTKSDEESLQRDKIEQTEKRTDETERRTYPEEIKNFVERAQSVPIPRSISSDVTLLDFAGQSLFYTTHQAFMSWRTLYLLVTDMSLSLTDAVEEGVYGIDVSGKRANSIQEYVTYWLNSVHSHVLIPEDRKTRGEESSGSGQGTPRNHPFVILVGTHTDKIPKDLLEERKKTYFNDIRIRLKNSPLRFHLVDEDFAISNLGSDPNINALKSKIFEISQKQVYWGEEIPARWISLSRALMELKNRGVQVMDYADVKSLNETLEVRIETLEELDLFLRFEHDMGNIVFFNTERLRKKVVLDPEWLIHGVKIWITSDQVIKRHPELTEQWFAFKNTGRLTSTLIEKLLSPHSEIDQHKEHLLDVMEKLNIIAKPLQREEEDYYWVPCMVSMPAPDDVKKLQQNKDTIKTSTLCFRPKTDFIHVGVFHRLLATCLSKWPPAKEGNTYLLFQGLCVFDLDNQHQLLLSLNDFVIHATVIRFTKKDRIPDLPLCMNIWDYLYSALSEISDCLCPGSELEICIKCKESSPLTNEGLHSVSTLRTEDELKCSTHKEAHCVNPFELLGFWEEDKKRIPVDVKPQHITLPSERFTRLSSLVLDVGSEILREVLTYCTTNSLFTLDQYMKNNEPDILKLQKRKVLTQAQVDIIFPQSGQTDINKYDITLASALLNNIYPSLGQQEKQIIIDLRTERNELAHSHSTKMSEQDFQTKWTQVKTILTDLSKLCKDPIFDNKIQKEIQDIQQSGSGAIISKMTEMTEELNKVRKILKEIQTT